MTEFSAALNNAMPPSYVDKFHLKEAPFADRYCASLFFEDETRKELLKKIAHLTDYTNLVLFVQGAAGLGKTSLIKHRLSMAKSSWRICFFNALDYVTPEAFAEKLAKDFQLKYSAKILDTKPAAFYEQIESLYQTGLTPVVIIDDVERLNRKLAPLLQALIRYEKNKRPLVRLIIVGEDIPDHVLNVLPVDNSQTAIKYLPIPPLSEKDMAAYIKYRLTQSGYPYSEPFNKSILQKIYLDSKGFPRHVNQLAHSVMTQHLQAAGGNTPRWQITDETLKILKKAAFALAVFLFLLTIYFFTNTGDENIIEPDLAAEIEKPADNEAVPEITQAPFADDIIGIKNSQTDVTVSEEKIVAPQPEKPVEASAEIEKSVKEVIAEKSATVVLPEPQTVPVPAQVTIPTPVPVLAEPVTSIKPEQPKPVVKKQEVKAVKSLSLEREWLNKQNPAHYTLQLIGSSSEKAAIEFIKSHNIEKDARFFHTKRKDKDWYFVVYKSFPNGRSAREAAENLHGSLQKTKPWIRSFKDIRKDLE